MNKSESGNFYPFSAEPQLGKKKSKKLLVTHTHRVEGVLGWGSRKQQFCPQRGLSVHYHFPLQRWPFGARGRAGHCSGKQLGLTGQLSGHPCPAAGAGGGRAAAAAAREQQSGL